MSAEAPRDEWDLSSIRVQPGPPTPPLTRLLTAGLEVDGRRVVTPIGEGATSAVYCVRDPELGDLALKVLDPGLDREMGLRFLREIDIATSLDHPGIVRVRGAGEVDGRPYLLMDLVEGARPLREFLRGRPLPDHVTWIRDAAAAIGYAHSRGVVHRDLHADNVLVDVQGRVRVTDFGLATMTGAERLTRTGDVLGSPCFMAPEQITADRQAIGPPADVWALGVMLYRSLTGALPFDGTFLELRERICAGRVVPPGQLSADVPPGLEAICLRCLRLNPRDRFPSAVELTAALDEYLREPLPPGDRSQARLRRRRAHVALAGFAVATVAVITTLWSAPGGTRSGPRENAPRIDEELKRRLDAEDLAGARDLITSRPGHPLLPILDAVLGGPVDLSALPAAERARVAAWRGDREFARRTLLEVGDTGHAAALAHELGLASGAASPAGSGAWASIAAGEAALRRREVGRAAIAFDEARRAATTEPERLSARLGLARVAFTRGDMRDCLEIATAARLEEHGPIERARCIEWELAAAWAAAPRGGPRDGEHLARALERGRRLAPGVPLVAAILTLAERESGDDAASPRSGELPGAAVRAQLAANLITRGTELARAAAFGGSPWAARRATEPLEAALRLDPDAASAWVTLSGAYVVLGEVAGAIGAADRAVALRPDAEAWAARARAAELSALRALLQADVARVESRDASLLDRTAAAALEPAITAWRRALAASADDPDVRLGLSRALCLQAQRTGSPCPEVGATVAPLLSGVDVAMLTAARRTLGRAVLERDVASTLAAEDALARAAPRQVSRQQLDALLLIASAGGQDAVAAAEALLALGGDLPARAYLAARRPPPDAARAVALAPWLPEPALLLAYGSAAVDPERLAAVVEEAPDALDPVLELLRVRTVTRSPVTPLARALVHLARGEGDEALSAATEAVSASPGGAAGHWVRARVMLERGPDARSAPDVLHDLDCARAAAPCVSGVLHDIARVGPPDVRREVLIRLLEHGLLRSHPGIAEVLPARAAGLISSLDGAPSSSFAAARVLADEGSSAWLAAALRLAPASPEEFPRGVEDPDTTASFDAIVDRLRAEPRRRAFALAEHRLVGARGRRFSNPDAPHLDAVRAALRRDAAIWAVEILRAMPWHVWIPPRVHPRGLHVVPRPHTPDWPTLSDLERRSAEPHVPLELIARAKVLRPAELADQDLLHARALLQPRGHAAWILRALVDGRSQEETTHWLTRCGSLIEARLAADRAAAFAQHDSPWNVYLRLARDRFREEAAEEVDPDARDERLRCALGLVEASRAMGAPHDRVLLAQGDVALDLAISRWDDPVVRARWLPIAERAFESAAAEPTVAAWRRARLRAAMGDVDACRVALREAIASAMDVRTRSELAFLVFQTDPFPPAAAAVEELETLRTLVAGR